MSIVKRINVFVAALALSGISALLLGTPISGTPDASTGRVRSVLAEAGDDFVTSTDDVTWGS